MEGTRMSLITIRGEQVDMPHGAVMGAEIILPHQRNWTEASDQEEIFTEEDGDMEEIVSGGQS